MQDLFAYSERFVQANGGFIRGVRLNEDNPRTTLARDALQSPNQPRCDAASAMASAHREVVDVDLAASLFELIEYVRSERADDCASFMRSERDEVRLFEQRLEVGVARDIALKRGWIFEHFPEELEHGFEGSQIGERYIFVRYGHAAIV